MNILHYDDADDAHTDDDDDDYDDYLVLVGSRNGFERDFTIKLRKN